MKKFKAFAFIFSLIASIGGLIISFYAGVIISIVSSFSANPSKIINTLVYISMLSNILAFISSFFYFKKPKFANFLIFVSIIMYSLVYVYILIKGSITVFSPVLLIITAPVIFMLISILFGFNAIKKKNN